MNYTTKRNIAFSFGIALASVALSVSLYYFIQAINGSAWLTITDRDAPVFAYAGATVGVSVAIVASLSTIFLALQAMGIAKEQAVMTAREAYIDDVKDFRADAHEAERLVLDIADKSLQHARAVRSFLIHRLPDFSHFAGYENEAALAHELGKGAVSAAILSLQDEPERRTWLAVQEIYNECSQRLPIDWSDDERESIGEMKDIQQLIREQIYTAATLQLETPEKRERLLKQLRDSIRSELLSVWRQRGEEVVTKSKEELVAATANAVAFILARERSFMFAELLEKNLERPEVEGALARITALVGRDEVARAPVHSGLDRLRYLITVANEPSVVRDDELKLNLIEIPERADGHLDRSLLVADPFLPRIVYRSGLEEPSWDRPHAVIDYLEPDDGDSGELTMRIRALNRHPVESAGADFEFFSFLLVTLRDLLNLSDAREAIEAHLTATGMPVDLAKTASESYARTIRPSVAKCLSRHVPAVAAT